METTAAIRQIEARLSRNEIEAPLASSYAVVRQRAGRIPIIALTAHSMKGDRERCLNAGMDAYLSKPIQAFELYKTIEELAAPSASADSQMPGGVVSGGVLNCNELLSNVDGDFELLGEIIALFRQDCQRLLPQMREAIANGNANVLSRAAHSLKGVLGTLSARTAHNLAQNLEQAAKAENLELAADLVQDLDKEMVWVQTKLDELLKGGVR
jgi:HPt (histidine-containing phosphotransfer) domain-containing protein